MPQQHVRGAGIIALFVINLGDTGRSVVKATPRPIYSLERTPLSIDQEAGWAPETVLTILEKVIISCLCRGQIPPRPSSSQLVIIQSVLSWFHKLCSHQFCYPSRLLYQYESDFSRDTGNNNNSQLLIEVYVSISVFFEMVHQHCTYDLRDLRNYTN